MRFLVDAQLPPALARWLGEKGFAATAVRDLGLREIRPRRRLGLIVMRSMAGD